MSTFDQNRSTDSVIEFTLPQARGSRRRAAEVERAAEAAPWEALYQVRRPFVSVLDVLVPRCLDSLRDDPDPETTARGAVRR